MRGRHRRFVWAEHDDVRAFEVGAAGGLQSAGDDGSTFRQKLAPVGKELWVVMLAQAMGFQTRPDIDMHAVGVLALRRRRGLRARSASPLRQGISLHRPCQEQQKQSAEQKMQDPRFGKFVIRPARRR